MTYILRYMAKKTNVKYWRISLATFLMSFVLAFSGYSQFVTTWKPRNGQITIPGKGNYTVHWENVSSPADNGTVNATDDVTINLSSPSSIYKVSITGGLTQIKFTSGANADKLQSIEQWGNIQWTSMEEAFHGCRYMTYSATDAPDLSRVTSMKAMFRNCQSFNGDLSNWNTSNITDMSQAFSFAFKFNQPIGNWDVSKVTTMQEMFTSAVAFNQPIGNWNTSKVTNMEAMFQTAKAFNQPIENWDVSKVTTMRRMFFVLIILADTKEPDGIAHRTTSTNSSFNQPLNNWNTASVTNMESMFQSADSFNQPLNNWNISNVTQMGSMFQSATKFNQNLGGWDITSVINMTYMIAASGLSLGNYDRTLIGWAAQNVQSNISIHAGGLKYCAAEASRNTLINTKNWTISNDTKQCPARDIEVQLDGVEISNGSATDFGAGTTIVKTFTIHNIGTTSALSLSGSPMVAITAGTAFAITEQPSATSVAAGGSLTFKVTYTAATNNDTGTLSIASNDPDEATYTIDLRGTLKKIDQTITFDLGNNATKTMGDATFGLTATGGASGNAITFTSSNTNVATISGTTVTIVGAGTTTITASQAGSLFYNAPADVTQTFTVNKGTQTITFDLGNNATKTFGDAAFDLTATGGASSNAITFTSSNTGVATISGTKVTIVGLGTTTITASQAGNDNYSAATDVTQTLTVQSTITALPQQLNSGKVSIFPNPVSHMLRVKITENGSYNYVEITMLNKEGKKVLLMGQAINNGQVEIPVDQLKAGEYLLQINTGGQTVVRRIVKI